MWKTSAASWKLTPGWHCRLCLPRGGTSDELNELVAQMIEVYLQEN